MNRDTGAVRTLRWSLIGIGILLPVSTLVPLGSLWLFQNGYVIPWALAAFATTAAAWALQRWLLAPPSTAEPNAADAAKTTAGADPGWTPAELAAWEKVKAVAAAADPDALASRDDVLKLGLDTVEAVALAIHPEKRQPLLQFTPPEALALVERVASRLGRFVEDSIPLADRLTVAQILSIYRSRGLIKVAEKAYDVWRVVRMINPATALATELRERISKEMVAWGKEHVSRRLMTAYVEEVGRAAIDLYGGRLRIGRDRLDEHVSSASRRDLARTTAESAGAEPLRILVAGQISAGKSSLVNALAAQVQAAVDRLPTTNAFTPYALVRDGLPAALIIDSPGLEAGAEQRDALVAEAAACDLVLWVSPANRADRDLDRQALAAFGAFFTAHPERRRPPLLLVLTHVDRLRPFQEWNPPYDLGDVTSAKAASMRGAIEAVCADLGLESDDVIPVCLADAHPPYNLDAVWARITDLLPDAQRARLVRTLRDAEGAWDWQRVWSQTKAGGRVLLKTLR